MHQFFIVINGRSSSALVRVRMECLDVAPRNGITKGTKQVDMLTHHNKKRRIVDPPFATNRIW